MHEEDLPGMVLHLAGIVEQTGLTGSTSEALRMIEQGAVRADGERVSDKLLMLEVGAEVVLQVGKRRFGRVRLV